MFNIIVFFVLFCFSFGPLKHSDDVGVQYNRNIHENRVKFPDERNAFIFVYQHGCRDDMCKPAIELTIYLIRLAIYRPNYETNSRTYLDATEPDISIKLNFLCVLHTPTQLKTLLSLSSNLSCKERPRLPRPVRLRRRLR